MSRDFDLSLGSDLSLAGTGKGGIEADTVPRPRRQHVSCERTPSQKPKSDLALWFSSLIYARAVWRLEVSFIIPFVAHEVSGETWEMRSHLTVCNVMSRKTPIPIWALSAVLKHKPHKIPQSDRKDTRKGAHCSVPLTMLRDWLACCLWGNQCFLSTPKLSSLPVRDS